MNNKRTYRVDELIEDSGFIDFVLGNASAEENRRWKEYLIEHPTEQTSVKEARLFIQQLSGEDTIINPADLDEVRSNLETMIREDKQKPRSISRLLVYAAAACVAFLFISLFLFNPEKTTLTATTGTQQLHTFADGSVVQLNAESNLSFDVASYNKNKRVLSLEGQAYFEVEKGKPFIVKSSSGQVEVLGTSFDVYDRNGLFIVGCKTGKVRVSSGTETTILSPGEEVRSQDNAMIKSTKNIDEIGSWEQGLFYYENIKLRRILNEVERQFSTSIECQPVTLGDQLYTGYFTKNQLDSALTNICWPLRLTFEHKNNTIVVSRN